MKKNLLIFAFSLISFLQANGQEDANLKGFAMTMNLDAMLKWMPMDQIEFYASFNGKGSDGK